MLLGVMAIRSVSSFAGGAGAERTKPRAGSLRLSWTAMARWTMGFAEATRRMDNKKVGRNIVDWVLG